MPPTHGGSRGAHDPTTGLVDPVPKLKVSTPMQGAPRLLFVVGAARSGTTLMRRILNSHPQIFISKETRFLRYRPAVDLLRYGHVDARVRPELRDLIEHCLTSEKWSKVEAIAGLLDRFDNIQDVYRHVCLLEAPPRELEYIGDNTPAYVGLLPVLFDLFPNSRAIHVVRDPRAVASSVMRLTFGANNARLAAYDWINAVGHGLAAEAGHPERVLRIRYEDVVRNPSMATARIARFLGVEEAFHPDHVGSEDSEFAGRMGHHTNLSRPIDPGLAEQWRTQLSPDELVEIERHTYGMALALGYDSPIAHPIDLDRGYYATLGLAAVDHLVRHVIRRMRQVLGLPSTGTDPPR